MSKLVHILLVMVFMTPFALADQAAGIAALERKDYRAAYEEFQSLAERGDAAAQLTLSTLYLQGWGVDQSDALGLMWAKASAEQGNGDAQFLLGILYAEGKRVAGNYSEAIRWYRLAAAQGNAGAMANLGVLYENGRGIPKNVGEAFRLFKASAEKGLPMGQSKLGRFYLEGTGVQRDYSQALRWFRLAANQGDAVAVGYLGMMYQAGHGVPVNHVNASALYQLAAALDDRVASNMLDLRRALEKEMTSEAVQIAEKLFARMREEQKIIELASAPTPVKRAPKPKHKPGSGAKPTSSARFPAVPASTPGIVSCNTRCINARCYRTYSDGRRVQFTARQNFNPFTRQFEFDSGPC